MTPRVSVSLSELAEDGSHLQSAIRNIEDDWVTPPEVLEAFIDAWEERSGGYDSQDAALQCAIEIARNPKPVDFLLQSVRDCTTRIKQLVRIQRLSTIKYLVRDPAALKKVMSPSGGGPWNWASLNKLEDLVLASIERELAKVPLHLGDPVKKRVVWAAAASDLKACQNHPEVLAERLGIPGDFSVALILEYKRPCRPDRWLIPGAIDGLENEQFRMCKERAKCGMTIPLTRSLKGAREGVHGPCVLEPGQIRLRRSSSE